MKIPRNLSGRNLVKVLCKRWGYQQVHQTGSHIILDTEEPTHHRLAVPAHASLRLGTLNAILRSVAAHKSTTKEAIIKTL